MTASATSEESVLRRLAKRVLPQGVRKALRFAGTIPARISFAGARPGKAWLDERLLLHMQEQSPPFPSLRYDPTSVKIRGRSRARDLIAMMDSPDIGSFLELGCWDGMVLAELKRAGKNVVGIDRRREGFDPRAVRQGVELIQMDAAYLEFPDTSFDAVFSYDCLEHVQKPWDVLREAARVTKPGGFVFLSFGPLYMSPWGAHLVPQIRVPYCHLLFTEDLLASFAAEHLGCSLDFESVNRLRVDEYRLGFHRLDSVLTPLEYRETREHAHLDLVRRYPERFRSCTERFDDLVVSSITVLFRRR